MNPRDDERRKFEVAARRVFGAPSDVSFEMWKDGRYIGGITQKAYEIWQMARAEQAETPRAAMEIVIEEINSSTGPTGGWLDSPKAVCAEIVARLEGAQGAEARAAVPVEDRLVPTPKCQDCGRENPVWFADNDVWNAVFPERVGFICPVCFINRADKVISNTGWKLVPEQELGACRIEGKVTEPL